MNFDFNSQVNNLSLYALLISNLIFKMHICPLLLMLMSRILIYFHGKNMSMILQTFIFGLVISVQKDQSTTNTFKI